jgi:hypothetical protein
MPSDSSTAADVLALWPLALAAALGEVSLALVFVGVPRWAAGAAVAGAALTALAALGLWTWMLSDADRYGDGTSHLHHSRHSSLYLAAGALVLALTVALVARRRPAGRWLLAASLAVSAVAALAQTLGFLAYSDGG